jgi:hypothetical protein
MNHFPWLSTAGWLFCAAIVLVLLTGCAVNGKPMRFDPKYSSKSRSWYVEGKTTNGSPFSCSFVEFDERGDFLDFAQHRHCEEVISNFVSAGPVLLLLYCHGWKNNSQSGDVTEFNGFLEKLAESEEIRGRNLRVHGVYLGWRGNAFLPYVDTNLDNQCYQSTLKAFGEPIVDRSYHRYSYWLGALPETLSYWSRKRGAEHLVSGLPLARAIFTYASAAKKYGGALDNRVCIMGHSFGALMLEKSLGQAMTGELTMEWWENTEKAKVKALKKPGLPFDLVLFVNSAAPSIYAKEMRDFLKAHRSALRMTYNPAQDVPVIVSITSTADWATGIVHPIGNCLAPFAPSLSRRYTNGIFGGEGGVYPKHTGIRQSAFYTKTPGHQPYLINHWIVKDPKTPLPADSSSAAIFSTNLSLKVTERERDLFFTSKAKHAAAAWRIVDANPGKRITLDGLPLAMQDSDYWIVSCGGELISGHNDVWSVTTMEMYAGIFRAVEMRRKTVRAAKSDDLDAAVSK